MPQQIAGIDHDEEGVISALRIDLRAPDDTDLGMSLLTAVEYITSDLGHRIALYGFQV